MGTRKTDFFGTPVSKWLDDITSADADRRFNERYRHHRQQVVKDDNGRQRFHGAFTGGFSAGYYNSVGTAEGFRPKTFVTHRRSSDRGSRNDEFGSQHVPEDYMDDEDFSEFGIAPKKLRLQEERPQSFKDVAFQGRRADVRSSPVLISFNNGLKILKKMTKGLGLEDHTDCSHFVKKEDFHGLGYRGLERSHDSSAIKRTLAFGLDNPLIAITNEGRKIEISGEAFGEGVLDDDGDLISSIEEYGIDHSSNYDFESRVRLRKNDGRNEEATTRRAGSSGKSSIDNFNVIGFEFSKCDDTMLLHSPHAHSLPHVPSSWVSPSRLEPYNYRSLNLAEHESHLAKLQECTEQSEKFGEKFTSSNSVTTLKTEDYSLGSGLLSYTDLKIRGNDVILPTKDNDDFITPTITRVSLEWHPCSLLCKRFNVPDPYPGHHYSGVKDHDLPKNPTSESQQSAHGEAVLAPIEMRKSIFNVQPVTTVSDTCFIGSSSDECEEDRPQILALDEVSNKCPSNHQVSNAGRASPDSPISDDCSDVLICEVTKQEPELIVLSSSSSSPDTARSRDTSSIGEHEEDAYGPPLPPIYSTLLRRTDQSEIQIHSSSRHRRSKKKYKKRH